MVSRYNPFPYMCIKVKNKDGTWPRQISQITSTLDPTQRKDCVVSSLTFDMDMLNLVKRDCEIGKSVPAPTVCQVIDFLEEKKTEMSSIDEEIIQAFREKQDAKLQHKREMETMKQELEEMEKSIREDFKLVSSQTISL